eukprot:scaffold290958_cov31-Tisochrysis_lutea.AAC.1
MARGPDQIQAGNQGARSWQGRKLAIRRRKCVLASWQGDRGQRADFNGRRRAERSEVEVERGSNCRAHSGLELRARSGHSKLYVAQMKLSVEAEAVG